MYQWLRTEWMSLEGLLESRDWVYFSNILRKTVPYDRRAYRERARGQGGSCTRNCQETRVARTQGTFRFVTVYETGQISGLLGCSDLRIARFVWLLARYKLFLLTYLLVFFDLLISYLYFIQIRDGLSVAHPLLRQYCSTLDPPPLQTTGPYAFIRFHSDGNGNDRGFQISFSATRCEQIIQRTFSFGNLLSSDTRILYIFLQFYFIYFLIDHF